MNYKITSLISSEPVTLEEARKHLRIEPFGSPLVHPDDDYILRLISASRAWCEEYTKRALATQNISVSLSEFPDDYIELPIEPVQSVTNITYIDTNGAQQTLSTNVWVFDDYENRIYAKYGQTFPSTQAVSNAVTVNYVAGYTDGLSPDIYEVPESIKQAILLMVGSYYENRQQDQMGNTRISFNSLPYGVDMLLQPYRNSLGV